MAYIVDPSDEVGIPFRLETGDFVPASGDGYLAGEFPGGITSVAGAPVGAAVRALYRPAGGAPGDGVVVASVLSAADGTWRINGLNTSLRYDVVGRKDGFNDVIMANVSPLPATGPVDPHFHLVSLLLHMDGAPGSTVFADKSPLALAVAAIGLASVTAAPTLFGSGSLDITAVTDGLEVDHDAALSFAGLDFTIELAAYFKAAPRVSGEYLLNKWNGVTAASDEFTFYVTDYGIALSFRGTGGGDFRTASAPFAFIPGQWYQLAVTRSGNDFSLIVDETVLSVTSLPYTINATTTPVTIGRLSGSPPYGCNVYIDEVRVTTGIARDIALQTAPFPDSD